jgi:sugar lactone lactonase YvrE
MSRRVVAVEPLRAIEGARVALVGEGLLDADAAIPLVQVGGVNARIVFASSRRIDLLVPRGLSASGPLPVEVADTPGEPVSLRVAAPLATGLHQVDNPAFDAEGRLYVTYSGTRGQEVPVSIFRVRPDGTRESYSSGIVNPTSLAVGPDGRLYASSRFEGTVYRLSPDGTAEPFATDLGVTCGLAFAPDGRLFVGDRTGTIFQVDQGGQARPFASLPASVAAFHVAVAPDGDLFVTGPTLSTRDAIYRIAPDGTVHVHSDAFGRPQGLAFDAHGDLFVVEALAGASGVYRLAAGAAPERYLSGPGLVGLAFDTSGGITVCSNDTAYRLDSDVGSRSTN